MYTCVFSEMDLFWRIYKDGKLVRIIHGYRTIVDWMDWVENVSKEQPVFRIEKG